MPVELREKLGQVFPNARTSAGLGYGLTECSALATIAFGPDWDQAPGSSGRALPTVEITICDENGNALPDGQEGEIVIRSPGVMLEYWKQPEATAKVLDGRKLRTGDIGRLEDGQLIINSRARDLILRGSENVYPSEIEQRLEAHPDVKEAAVIGVDHEELGQEVKAVIVLEEGGAAASTELEKWVAGALAAFKVPAHWEFRHAALPRNAVGKVMKHLLDEGSVNPFSED